VVGGALSGAIETAIYYSSAARGAVLAGLLVVIAIMAIGPIVQVLAFVIVYKLTAALVQPICDERITDAIDVTGDYAGLVLGACFMAAALFVFIALATLTL
jgi:stage III sporulation protein AE